MSVELDLDFWMFLELFPMKCYVEDGNKVIYFVLWRLGRPDSAWSEKKLFSMKFELMFLFWTKCCATCRPSEFRLVRAMWLLDLLVV